MLFNQRYQCLWIKEPSLSYRLIFWNRFCLLSCKGGSVYNIFCHNVLAGSSEQEKLDFIVLTAGISREWGKN